MSKIAYTIQLIDKGDGSVTVQAGTAEENYTLPKSSADCSSNAERMFFEILGALEDYRKQ